MTENKTIIINKELHKKIRRFVAKSDMTIKKFVEESLTWALSNETDLE